MELTDNTEFIATLTKVESSEEGQIKITLSIQTEIEIPVSAISFDKLNSFVGKRIGILNINSQFFVRKIKSR